MPTINWDRLQVVIVHDSIEGNGRKLAETLQHQFEQNGATVTVDHVSNIDPESIAEYSPDLVVVGAAVRAFHVSSNSRKWIRDLAKKSKSSKTEIPFGAVFLTHAMPNMMCKGYGGRLRNLMERMSAAKRVYPQWLSGRVLGQKGPLEDSAESNFLSHASDILGWMSKN